MARSFCGGGTHGAWVIIIIVIILLLFVGFEEEDITTIV